MIVSLGSKVFLFCGLKLKDFKRVFIDIFGFEEFVYSMLDVICLDCIDEFLEGVLGVEVFSLFGYCIR